MKRQDYYPSLLAEQVAWLRHFASRLPHHAPALQLKAEEVAGIVADALWLVYVLGGWRAAARATARAIAATLEHAQTGKGAAPLMLPVLQAPPLPEGVAPRPPGALRRIFKYVQIIKHRPGYTLEIGTDLGLLTRADTREHPVPTFTLAVKRVATREVVVVRAEKWGREGIAAQSRRGGGDWEDLPIITIKTYEDKRPLLVPGQPELRHYRLRFWDGRSPTGPWSPEATITVSP